MLEQAQVVFLVDRQFDPVVSPGGKMHGIGERQAEDPVQARRNQRFTAQDGGAEVCGNDMMFASFGGDRNVDLPAFRLPKTVLPAGVKRGFGLT